MRHEAVFFLGIGWMTILLGMCVLLVARATTPARRILALDLLALVLVGVLALVAGEDRLSYALDAALALSLLSFVATVAAARYAGDRRPYS